MSQEVRPIRPSPGWPISHLNAGTAGIKQLKGAPGKDMSHFVTGYILNGAGDADGFHLLRRNCLVFNSATDTLTIADNSTDYDWGTLAADGDFSLEIWVRLPVATTTVANLVTRGDEASDGWNLEIASGKAKFTMHDGTHTAAAITTSKAINDDNWHLITVTVDRDETDGLNIYIDGLIAATAVDATASTDAMDGGTDIVLTGQASSTVYVSAFGMYLDLALSAATILSNYNGGVGRKYHGAETSLVFAHNCDEGISTATYDIMNTAAHVGTLSNVTWSPSKQNGSTAAVEVCGAPFDRTKGHPRAAETDLGAVGKFTTGKLSTNGVYSPIVMTFPHAIKIGRNCPLNILETDGAFDLILFGYTDYTL